MSAYEVHRSREVTKEQLHQLLGGFVTTELQPSDMVVIQGAGFGTVYLKQSMHALVNLMVLRPTETVVEDQKAVLDEAPAEVQQI